MHTVKLDSDIAAAPHIGEIEMPRYRPAAIGIKATLYANAHTRFS